MHKFIHLNSNTTLKTARAALQRGWHAVQALAWPQLLLACFALALLISVFFALLPLALGLFVLVLLYKFFRGVFGSPQPARLSYDIEQEPGK